MHTSFTENLFFVTKNPFLYTTTSYHSNKNTKEKYENLFIIHCRFLKLNKNPKRIRWSYGGPKRFLGRTIFSQL